MVNVTIGDAGYGRAEYVITFSYTVGGKTYQGKYLSGSPREDGHTFEIQYDPNHAERNTGTDVALRPWVKVLTWILGGALAMATIWFFERE